MPRRPLSACGGAPLAYEADHEDRDGDEHGPRRSNQPLRLQLVQQPRASEANG